MKRSKDIFISILRDTNNTTPLYSYLKDFVRPPYDCSDLLRWQWAQSVSAFDKLIHDLVRVGMIETYIGRRAPTKKFLDFAFSVDVHLQILQDPYSACSLFEQQIVHKHSFLSFQDPDKISDVLSNIWNEKQKWSKIAQEIGLDEMFLRTKLKNISIRRNQIVHEGDYSNSLLLRQPVSEIDVTDVLVFIEDLGVSIYDLVKL